MLSHEKWTSVGGLMTQLHAIHRGIDATRLDRLAGHLAAKERVWQRLPLHERTTAQAALRLLAS